MKKRGKKKKKMGEDKKKILIVEDDDMIRSMYRTKFEADGYIVVDASNGSDGLEIAKKEKPDLIMLDIILPQLDGFAVLKELRASSVTKDTFIAMLTNLGTEEDKSKGEKLGANAYLVKANFTPAQISNEVKNFLK